MLIKPQYEPETGSWTYLLADPESGQAALIDPVWGYDPVSGRTDASAVDRLIEEARQQGLTIAWVLETHAHADHLTAAHNVRQLTGARVAIGRGIGAVQQTVRQMFGLPDEAGDEQVFDRLLAEGDTLALGGLTLQVLETPGHTPDSITYLVGDAAFIGDTLFAPSHGTARCDFPGGNAGELYDSITRLHALPDDTRLFLCHDYPEKGNEPQCDVTVRDSRQHNIHLRAAADRDSYIALRQQRDAKLGLPRLIMPALQVNIRAGRAPQPRDNGRHYLLQPFNHSMAELTGKNKKTEKTEKT